jgi:hypothetical protein
MSGRGAGHCAGFDRPGYANPMPGRGVGMGRGRGRGWFGGGRGWRHRYYATGTPGWACFRYAPAWGTPPTRPLTREQEAEFLKAQAEGLQQQLDTICQRIAELEQED